jgi:hypothetical protein
VSNAGPSPTTDRLVVTDTLPSTLTYTSSSGTGWACSASGQVVTCTNDAVVAAAAAAPPLILNTAVDAPAATSITNTASVAGGSATATGTGSGVVSAGVDVRNGRPPGTTDERLAFTGSRVARMVLLAMTLVSLGVIAVAADRRRNHR